MKDEQGGKGFDPFEAEPLAAKGSKSWLWATATQAICTCALLALSAYAEGKPWERHVRLIVLLGIVGTWSLALRTIRERLLELMRHWHRASQGLLRKASDSGRHLISVRLNTHQERYIKGSIWRLRIIAEGITIPFFVMPFIWSFISMGLCFTVSPLAQSYWEGVALFMMVSALVVAGYFHWVILPLPKPVRVSGASRRISQRRVPKP